MRCSLVLACIPFLLAACGGSNDSPSTVVSGASATAPPPSVAAAAPPPPVNRSAVDQPDDVQGAQVHLIYAIPADGADRAIDLSQTLASTTGSFNNWLAGQTGGRRLRFDTYQGGLDVTFARLPRTDAEYDAFGQRKRDNIEADLNQMTLLKPDKIYAVYYDGNNVNACADAPQPPALPGQVAVLYLRGAVPASRPCYDIPFAASPDAVPGYLEFTMLHELLHTLGAVDPRAPYAAPHGHTGLDPNDLMYAGPVQWTPRVLDFNKSNYYNPNGLPGGLFNLANSSYLTP